MNTVQAPRPDVDLEMPFSSCSFPRGRVRIVLLLLFLFGLLYILAGRSFMPKVTDDVELAPESAVKSAFNPPFFYMDKHDVKSRAQGYSLIKYPPVELDKDMSLVQRHDALISLAQQAQLICHKWEMFGKQGDGSWPVCLIDKLLPSTPCVIYSYGVNFDWNFEDAFYHKLGCQARTFDPSMNRIEHPHSPGVFFYPIGVSNRDHVTNHGWHMRTHKQLLTRFKEENMTLPYLKLDVEGYEYSVLENMIADGVLNNVMQLSFEIHTTNPIYGHGAEAHVNQMFNAIKRLEAVGFRRWYYRHRLNGFPFQCDQSFVNTKFL